MLASVKTKWKKLSENGLSSPAGPQEHTSPNWAVVENAEYPVHVRVITAKMIDKASESF
jgi:hypothetical protein